MSATSSKGECEECDVCILFEKDVIQEECEPRCYLVEEEENTTNTAPNSEPENLSINP